jgi:hypothetical protein
MLCVMSMVTTIVVGANLGMHDNVSHTDTTMCGSLNF